MKKFFFKVVRFFADYLLPRNFIIAERNQAWSHLDVLRSHILTTKEDTLANLKQMVETGKDMDPPRIMPGSDVGLGKLNIQHWATAAIAHSFMDTLDSVDGADNYVTIIMQHPKTLGRIEVTIRRPFGISPAEKNRMLEDEIKELKKQLEEHNVQERRHSEDDQRETGSIPETLASSENPVV